MYVECLNLYQKKSSGKWDAVVHLNTMIIIISSFPQYKNYACHNNWGPIGFNYDVLAWILYKDYGIELPSVDNLIRVHEDEIRVYYATVGVPFTYPKSEGGYIKQVSGCY